MNNKDAFKKRIIFINCFARQLYIKVLVQWCPSTVRLNVTVLIFSCSLIFYLEWSLFLVLLTFLLSTFLWVQFPSYICSSLSLFFFGTCFCTKLRNWLLSLLFFQNHTRKSLYFVFTCSAFVFLFDSLKSVLVLILCASFICFIILHALFIGYRRMLKDSNSKYSI